MKRMYILLRGDYQRAINCCVKCLAAESIHLALKKLSQKAIKSKLTFNGRNGLVLAFLDEITQVGSLTVSTLVGSELSFHSKVQEGAYSRLFSSSTKTCLFTENSLNNNAKTRVLQLSPISSHPASKFHSRNKTQHVCTQEKQSLKWACKTLSLQKNCGITWRKRQQGSIN